MTNLRSNQRKTCLVFLDRSLALSLEGGIQQGKLPPRRRLPRHNAVLPAVEVKIFRLVAYIMKRGQSRSHMKVHVSQVAMLCGVKTNPNRGGIALFDLEDRCCLLLSRTSLDSHPRSKD